MKIKSMQEQLAYDTRKPEKKEECIKCQSKNLTTLSGKIKSYKEINSFLLTNITKSYFNERLLSFKANIDLKYCEDCGQIQNKKWS